MEKDVGSSNGRQPNASHKPVLDPGALRSQNQDTGRLHDSCKVRKSVGYSRSFCSSCGPATPSCVSWQMRPSRGACPVRRAGLRRRAHPKARAAVRSGMAGWSRDHVAEAMPCKWPVHGRKFRVHVHGFAARFVHSWNRPHRGFGQSHGLFGVFGASRFSAQGFFKQCRIVPRASQHDETLCADWLRALCKMARTSGKPKIC